jgi:hypothetical protein
MSIDERPETRSKIWDTPVLRNFAPPAETPPTVEDPIEIVPWQRPGSTLRKKTGLARRGFYAPALAGAPTTTRQAEILNTAIIGAQTGTHGIVTGRDVLSRTAIAHDPVTGYNGTPRTVSSPNVVILGDVGSGKSSMTKTAYVPDFIQTPNGGVSRCAKIYHVLARSGNGAAEMVEFIDADIDGVITLFDDFNHGTHGSAGRFPMGELIALKDRVERAVKFLHRLVR